MEHGGERILGLESTWGLKLRLHGFPDPVTLNKLLNSPQLQFANLQTESDKDNHTTNNNIH